MKNNFKILFILFLLITAGENISAIDLFTGGINPHDSLLFDGETMPSFNLITYSDDIGCYSRVQEVKGTVIGKVLTKEIVKACGEDETVYTAVERFLKKGDMLMHGSEVTTSVDSRVELGIYMMETTFNSAYIEIGPESHVTTPSFTTCKVSLSEKPEEEIKVIEGIITYDAKPDAGIKTKTTGKRSSGKHKKTRYSHEVKIDGIDTVDVIRVYKGSVEVSMENIEPPNEEEMTKNLEKLGEDLQAGKITAEEMQVKMKEFQFYGQNLNELIQPLNVDEGFKCTVTKSTRVVEPLGPGDSDSK
jgi:hypothetical protein